MGRASPSGPAVLGLDFLGEAAERADRRLGGFLDRKIIRKGFEKCYFFRKVKCTKYFFNTVTEVPKVDFSDDSGHFDLAGSPCPNGSILVQGMIKEHPGTPYYQSADSDDNGAD